MDAQLRLALSMAATMETHLPTLANKPAHVSRELGFLWSNMTAGSPETVDLSSSR